MRTIIYIDGFNLYYGCLKKTPYKWFDLEKLFSQLLDEKNKIISIKYFTAKIREIEGDKGAPKRQNLYLKALKSYSKKLEIHYGHFLCHPVIMPLVDPVKKSERFAKVFKTEEKGSDVNLAVHLLNDAWLNAYDCAIIVSNDSDLSESMKLIKDHHPEKMLGLVTPGVKWRTSEQLRKYSDFVRKIRPTLLRDSQLPDSILGTPLCKPVEW